MLELAISAWERPRSFLIISDSKGGKAYLQCTPDASAIHVSQISGSAGVNILSRMRGGIITRPGSGEGKGGEDEKTYHDQKAIMKPNQAKKKTRP